MIKPLTGEAGGVKSMRIQSNSPPAIAPIIIPQGEAHCPLGYIPRLIIEHHRLYNIPQKSSIIIMNSPQNTSPNYEQILKRIQQKLEGLETHLSLKDTRVDFLAAQLKAT